MPNLIATCAPENIDTATLTCSHLEWVNYAGGLPPLSAADGAVISGAIAAVWAVGYLVRISRKTAEENA
ncbi:hypothetical protein [Dyella sp. ASV21]|uniref:hypothetical protein n=1 Tax=Dyella sp. ASV21 TaxID=2795114 RepID=UPI0018EB6C5A|nr:hypothetical protein [Dyella sp. ASV21]